MAYKAGEKVLKKKKDEIWEQNVKNQFRNNTFVV